MNTKIVWTLFLTFFTLCTVYIVGNGLFQWHDYQTRSAWTLPVNLELSIKELRKDRYIPTASYKYKVDKKDYQGRDDLESYPYMREEALESDLTNITYKNPWKVWYNPNKPWTASLKRTFPTKELIYSVIMVGLFFYFLFLKRYAKV